MLEQFIDSMACRLPVATTSVERLMLSSPFPALRVSVIHDVSHIVDAAHLNIGLGDDIGALLLHLRLDGLDGGEKAPFMVAMVYASQI